MLASERMLQQADALQRSGRLPEAEALLRKLLEVNPDLVHALGMLGMLLRQTGRVQEAAECFRRICLLEPTNPKGLLSFGICLGMLHKLPAAAAILREAVRVAPTMAAAHANLANVLLALMQLTEAERECRAALAIEPNGAPSHSNLAAILNGQNRYGEALPAADTAIALAPDLPDAHYHRGIALRAMKRMEEAVDAMTKAVELRPQYPEAEGALAMLLSGFGEATRAAQTIEKALAAAPRNADLQNAAGLVLHTQGRIDEAIAHYARASELNPEMWVAGSNRLLAMHDIDQPDRRAVFEQHVAWGKRYAAPLRDECRFTFRNIRIEERPLRIGYVSPDFRYHSVAHFLRPVIQFHDRKRFEIFCYSGVGAPDGWTQAFRSMNVVWRDASKMDDRQLAEQINADVIDIAVDCSGHTSGHRLLSFARKPAPVQVSFLGYPNTAGVDAIDYRITDTLVDPPGESDRLHVEKLVRLPIAWCFAAAADAPDVAPERELGPIRFGSFTSLPKLTPRWAGVWSKILQRVPDSRFLLKTSGTHDPTVRNRVLEMFTAHGIAADRIELLQRQRAVEDHLASYHRVDISLDTFPYDGTTTTCEAMYMGVPVITCAGEIHASRVGVSLLSAVGLNDLIAQDEAAYIDIATALAADSDRLRELHATLRQRMIASPLMDAPAYVSSLEDAYRATWRTWCRSDNAARSSSDRLNIESLISAAVEHYNEDRLPEADELLQRAFAIDPDNIHALATLAAVRVKQDRYAEAIAPAKAALASDPNRSDTHHALGVALLNLGRLNEAIVAISTALELAPDHIDALISLAWLLNATNQPDEAEATIKRALTIAPERADAHNNFATILQSQGRMAEAIDEYRRAVELNPANSVAHSNLLLALHYVDQPDPKAVFDEHVAWAKQHAPLAPAGIVYTNDRSGDRSLRIAYLSNDFRYHSVAHFLRAIIPNHDRRAFQIYCYSGVGAPDEWTAAFKAMDVTWRDALPLGYGELAEQIRADQIDIAVDCAGHTARHRLAALALKPAPVQVSFLGYPDTTGLAAIDYRITDSLADPPGETERFHTEKLIRIDPTAWCYAGAAVPQARPDASEGPLTFGSFATLTKLTPRWAAVWCEILRRVADSRLVLKAQGLNDASLRARVLELFTPHSIDARRVELLPRQPSAQAHLDSYNRVDIALDTFPYHGTTTTCEALYMGVPVVTMAGRVHVSRVGVSLLSAVGLPELIARDQADYIELAVSLAKDAKRLRELHHTLRSRMERSALMDAQGYVAKLEQAYRMMWRTWVRTPAA